MEKLRAFCLTAQPLGGRAATQGHGAWCSSCSSQSHTANDGQVLHGGHGILSRFSFPPSSASLFLSLISFLSLLFSPSFLLSFFLLSSSFPSFLPFSFPPVSFNLLLYCFIYFVSVFSLDKPGPTVHYCRIAGLSSRAQTFILTL